MIAVVGIIRQFQAYEQYRELQGINNGKVLLIKDVIIRLKLIGPFAIILWLALVFYWNKFHVCIIIHF